MELKNVDNYECLLYRAIFDHSAMDVIVVDLEGRVIKFNLTKKKSGDRLPKIGDFMYVNYGRNHINDMRYELMECIRTQKEKRFPKQIYGDKILSIIIKPFSMGAVISCDDITEIVKMQELIKESERKYRLIADHSADVISVLDMDLKVTYVSPSVYRVRGYTAEEVIGQTAMQIVVPNSLKTINKVFSEEMAIEETGSADPKRNRIIELEEFCKDGSTIWVESNFHFIRDNNGKAISILSVSRDISERKRAEKILLNSERERIISDMTIGISHEFNNALQVIIGNIELALLSHVGSPDYHDYLKIAKVCASGIASRIKQMQRFTEKFNKVEKIAIELNELLDEVIFQTKPLWKNSFLEENSPAITFQKFYGENIYIEGDISEINYIFHNIIKNAIEAMPSGGTITITTWSIDGMVNICIADTGIGMDDNTKKRVFQPFFSTKSYNIGKGFGMSHVYTIVRDHDGTISIDNNNKDKGVIVKITFPYFNDQVRILK